MISGRILHKRMVRMPELRCGKCYAPGWIHSRDHAACCIGHLRDTDDVLRWCDLDGRELSWRGDVLVCAQCAAPRMRRKQSPEYKRSRR